MNRQVTAGEYADCHLRLTWKRWPNMKQIWNNLDILRRGRRLGWILLALAALSHLLLALLFRQMTDAAWSVDKDLGLNTLTAYTDAMLHLAMSYFIAYGIGVVLIVPCWCRIDAINKRISAEAQQKN